MPMPRNSLLLLLILTACAACSHQPVQPQPVAVPQRKVLVSPELLTPARREKARALEALLQEVSSGSTQPLPTR